MSNREIINIGGVQKKRPESQLARAVRAANGVMSRSRFTQYAIGKSKNTLRRQSADLAAFTDFLRSVGVAPGDLANDPASWTGVTWGLVQAFQRWMLQEGYSIGTCNVRLVTIRVYADLAYLAGHLKHDEIAKIKMVKGFSHKEGRNINEKRLAESFETRRDSKRGMNTSQGTPVKSTKKAHAVLLTQDQAETLKNHPDSPQGRRDALLMCLLLDHGLRCGEVAILQVENFDLEAGTMRFYRPKVDKVQTHRLSPDTLRAARAYLAADQEAKAGPLLLGSRKNGSIYGAGGHYASSGALTQGKMSTQAITNRVRFFGEFILRLENLGAHDCRHYWATAQARKGVPVNVLMEAGGWASLAMPMRYIEAAKIANDGCF